MNIEFYVDRSQVLSALRRNKQAKFALFESARGRVLVLIQYFDSLMHIDVVRERLEGQKGDRFLGAGYLRDEGKGEIGIYGLKLEWASESSRESWRNGFDQRSCGDIGYDRPANPAEAERLLGMVREACVGIFGTKDHPKSISSTRRKRRKGIGR